MTTMVVDRIEGDRAVLEVGDERIEVPVSVLPEGAGEGSVLSFALDTTSEAAIRAEAEARLERLKASSPDDDVIDL